jgi:hypothetical protein
LVHVCIRTDAADVLRLAAGAHVLSAQTQTDEKYLFGPVGDALIPSTPVHVDLRSARARMGMA